jgi:hypothetical protein
MEKSRVRQLLASVSLLLLACACSRDRHPLTRGLHTSWREINCNGCPFRPSRW